MISGSLEDSGIELDVFLELLLGTFGLPAQAAGGVPRPVAKFANQIKIQEIE